MKTTLNTPKLAICVFRIGDIETDCDNCKREKLHYVPEKRIPWQYVPKVNDGEECPSFVANSEPVNFDNYDAMDDGK